jgi:hypothetical protein
MFTLNIQPIRKIISIPADQLKDKGLSFLKIPINKTLPKIQVNVRAIPRPSNLNLNLNSQFPKTLSISGPCLVRIRINLSRWSQSRNQNRNQLLKPRSRSRNICPTNPRPNNEFGNQNAIELKINKKSNKFVKTDVIRRKIRIKQNTLHFLIFNMNY